MAHSGHRIVVIGASAGGLEALEEVIGGLPGDLPASLFIVQHIAPEYDGTALRDQLSRRTALDCRYASHGEIFRNGHIYIAPPDHHLLVKSNTMLVTKGARENRHRPGIDPLFRSAAVAHGASVIGVILTGMLDDGTAGLIAIQRCGGVTVVQDPNDAAYPGMPQSALNHLKIDHCVGTAAMGRLLAEIVQRAPGRKSRIPDDVRTEALIAERVLSNVAQVNRLGTQVPYNCPNCGGVLWEMDKAGVQRYRCHTGHSFTAASLAASQTEKIEETLWICLRMLEERKNLLGNMSRNETRPGAKKTYAERIRETDTHVDNIRAMLIAEKSPARRDDRR